MKLKEEKRVKWQLLNPDDLRASDKRKYPVVVVSQGQNASNYRVKVHGFIMTGSVIRICGLLAPFCLCKVLLFADLSFYEHGKLFRYTITLT